VNLPLVVHPRADLDVMECFTYLAQRNAAAAKRFLDAIEQLLPTIASRPNDGHRYLHAKRETEDWRYVRVPGFKKYLAFYRITDAAVEVVRIVHGSRDLETIFRVL
jgi:toxin ParE1/3/4